jgi:hypothetical protein
VRNSLVQWHIPAIDRPAPVCADLGVINVLREVSVRQRLCINPTGSPRTGAIFRELLGKLEPLDVEYDKCGRDARYGLDRLTERYGIDGKLFDCDDITADCPRRPSGRHGQPHT